MALQTYNDLLTQVPLWLARPTDVNILPSVPDWVTLAEERIAYGGGRGTQFPSEKLRIRAMETMVPLVLQPVTAATLIGGSVNAITATVPGITASLTLGVNVQLVPLAVNSGAVTLNVNSLGATTVVKGSALAPLVAGDLIPGATYNFYFDGTRFIMLSGNAHVPLPPGYLSSRECYIDMAPRRYLDYIVPDQMNRLYGYAGSGADIGTPHAYTVEVDSIRFAPAPDTTYFFWIDYFQKFPSLITAGSNWLMSNAPSVYLFGTLIESAPFIGHDNRLQLWYSRFQTSIDGLQEQDQADRHSGALMTMRPQHWCP